MGVVAKDSGEPERVTVASRAELRAWLEENHESSPGIWLVTWKKSAAPDKHLPYDDLVEEALCFGWVDSQAKGVDDQKAMQRLTPRKPKSSWSRVNKQRIARLIEAGLMMPAGIAVVEAAKKSGTWVALHDVEAGIEPPELAAALDATPDARKNWDAFPRSTRRSTLEWIGSAKTEPTRDKRIAQTVELAAENLRANQWPRPTS